MLIVMVLAVLVALAYVCAIPAAIARSRLADHDRCPGFAALGAAKGVGFTIGSFLFFGLYWLTRDQGGAGASAAVGLVVALAVDLRVLTAYCGRGFLSTPAARITTWISLATGLLGLLGSGGLAYWLVLQLASLN